jgi:hypothetical protein
VRIRPADDGSVANAFAPEHQPSGETNGRRRERRDQVRQELLRRSNGEGLTPHPPMPCEKTKVNPHFEDFLQEFDVAG